MSISSNKGEFAKKRKLGDKAFLEIGSVATTTPGQTAVSFNEPWNVAPTVYIEVVSGSEVTAAASGSLGVSGITTTGFIIYSGGTGANSTSPTVKWIAVRFSDRTT